MSDRLTPAGVWEGSCSFSCTDWLQLMSPVYDGDAGLQDIFACCTAEVEARQPSLYMSARSCN